ncbi:MAG: CTP synthase [Pseudomonas sp.]|uniref:CTP synthase C-terminal region-related (seleno)protein n=1 Tax=Pseudomonas abieticivorans TaxID=2931382 RepID=UPI0020C020B2|nr:CTP synthase [Pseudomonas sp. PIA16]MDE1164622.1 CTP synthase [Pseudomonas sp.]
MPFATPLKIALIGDYDETVTAHRAIDRALPMAAEQTGLALQAHWLATDAIDTLEGFDAIWCVPASPYRDTEAALQAIGHARVNGIPFLGTCGGFQHALLEYARNVLGWQDAEHGETAPDAPRTVISRLSCSLVEARQQIRLTPGSAMAQAYGCTSTDEGYRCNFGINPAFAEALTAGPLRVSGRDENNEIRAVELAGHRFFLATLFQPERAALAGHTPPLVAALVQAAGRYREAR